MEKPRLVLVDDHRLVRESLSKALGDTHRIVAAVGGAAELIRVLEEHAADCVLLDLDMPGLHGLQLLRKVRHRYPALKVIVVTMHADRLMASAAIREGADGFVAKDASVAELRCAIAEVCAGARYVSPHLSRARNHLRLESHHPALQQLTPRQQEIVLLMGEGKSATVIANSLGVGHSTITFHKQNAMRTLGMASHDALVQFAVLVRSSADPAPSTVAGGGVTIEIG